ncbi:MAG: hypothetical protein ACYC0Q_05760 [Eubacteriales bacterium]
MNMIDWFIIIGIPNCTRVLAYSRACSMAERANPTALDATLGLDLSKTRIISLKPPPSWPRRLASGTTASSMMTPAVSEARWPILSSFLPMERLVTADPAGTARLEEAVP